MWPVLRSLLFQLDAERAHHLTTRMACSVGALSPALLRQVCAYSENLNSETRAFGVSFRNPIGLAAGFDKNADFLSFLPHMGFGFAEIGSVTPRPQPGNPKPRLFRDPRSKNIYNCMGFNNDGAAVVADRLERARGGLPINFRVGVNLGKNKDTPLEKAAEDYAEALRFFEGLGDYFVINVSSPNTPGLRALQSLDALQEIVDRCTSVMSSWREKNPLIIKFSPELVSSSDEMFWEKLEKLPVVAYILTNTLASDWSGKPCGKSGRALKDVSYHALQRVRAFTKKEIISVGGIDGPEELKRRKEAGASLFQVYSALVYQGPRLVSDLLRAQV